jgi:hypothetical protein
MADIQNIVKSVERAPSVGPDTHDFSNVYRELSDLQRQDGGGNSTQFQQDLGQINAKLHNDGVLPNPQITGIDGDDHILTKNISGDTDVVQNKASVQDFGHETPDESARLFEDQMLARAFGASFTQNPDGSFNLTSPFDRQSEEEAAASILKTVFNGLLGGGSAGDSRSGDDESLPFGMNPILAQAWRGWGDEQSDPG